MGTVGVILSVGIHLWAWSDLGFLSSNSDIDFLPCWIDKLGGSESRDSTRVGSLGHPHSVVIVGLGTRQRDHVFRPKNVSITPDYMYSATQILIRYSVCVWGGGQNMEIGISDPHKFICGSGIPKMSIRIQGASRLCGSETHGNSLKTVFIKVYRYRYPFSVKYRQPTFRVQQGFGAARSRGVFGWRRSRHFGPALLWLFV